MDERTIFEQALDHADEVSRDAFLRRACGEDTRLRDRVDLLLAAHGKEFRLLDDQVLPAVETAPVSRRVDFSSQTIGRYKLLQKIGEGGFGVVYMAEQQRPVRRKVAIKIIKPGMDTKEVIARFEAERQALALMDHPNIARVLDAGETDEGRPYFAMELVKGVPLTDFCDQNKLSGRERLDLFLTICRAIQHAHQKGIIHRDLKPSNVMITLHDNKPMPKVIDFGVSKAISQQLTEKTLFTAYGQMVGTPAYMSPEQAQLSALDIDTRSDVYSLGVLLYELLTGTTPLDAKKLRSTAYAEIQRLIVEEEAPKPSTRFSTLGNQQARIAVRRGTDSKALQQFVSGDLDWIVMKALDKERNRRYESASHFADDIERFLHDVAVEARPPSTAYKLRKFIRRNRRPVIVASALLATLCLGLIGTSIGLVSARRSAILARLSAKDAQEAQIAAAEERDAAIKAGKAAEAAGQDALTAREEAVKSAQIAVQAQKEAEHTAEQRRRLLYAANMQLADKLWNSPNGDLRKIEELLTAWIPTDGSPEDWRDFSWRYQWTRLHKSAAVTGLETTGATVSANGNLLTADKDGLREWDESGTRATPKWTGDASKVIFSPGRRWAAVNIDEVTKLVEIATGRAVIDIPHKLCSFSARGEFLAAWDAGTRTAQVWKLSEDGPAAMEPLVATGEAKMPDVSTKLQLSDDGQSFLLRGYPIYPCVSAFFPGEQQPFTWWHRNSAQSCAWSPNGQIMASGSHTGMVHLRLRTDPLDKFVLSTHGKNIDVLRFSPDGTRLAVGGSDGTFDLWDTSALLEFSNSSEPNALASGIVAGESTGQSPRLAPSAHDGTDSAVTPSGDEGNDGSLPPSARPLLLGTTNAHLSGGIQSLVFSPDGSKLASFASGVSKLWDLQRVKGRYEVADFGEDLFSGRLGFEIEDSERGVTVKRINSPYHDVVSGEIRVGDRIIGVSDDMHGDLTDLVNMETTDLYPLLAGPYRSVVRLTVEDESNSRREVELRRTNKSDPRPIRVCFSPDGITVAIAGQRTGTTSIDLVTGRSRRYPQVGSNSVAISPLDGRLLAMDGLTDVLVWDLHKDQEHARLDGSVSVDPIPQNATGGSLAFSPDGKFLAMGTGYAYNATPKRSDLKVWRVSDLKEIGTPVFKNDRVLSDITFTPDSSHLIATDHAGIVRVWNTKTWELLERQFDIGSGSAAIAISRDGKTLATGGSGQTVLWDFATGSKLRVLSGASPWALDFSTDGRTLVSGSRNHSVILWDVATGMQLRTFHAHSDAVKGVAFSPDGNRLATVGSEGVLRLWQAAPLEEIDSYPPTFESMLRLGELRNREDRYAEAEDILRRLLQLQKEQLPEAHPDIYRTRAELTTSLKGQGELPMIDRQPESVKVATGDSVELRVGVSGDGPWAFQWFRNGHLVEGATHHDLRFTIDSEGDFGSYHVEIRPFGQDDVVPVASRWAHVVERQSVLARGLRWEVFKNIPGSKVGDLTQAVKFPFQPDSTEIIDAFEIPPNSGDNYGGRVTGLISPPVTGEYVFYLTSDDASELYLSDDDLPNNEKLIAGLSTWTPPRWDAANVSQAIHLQRGKRYWIRALMKEGGVGDHLAVAWQLPGAPPPKNGDPPISGDFLEHRREQLP